MIEGENYNFSMALEFTTSYVKEAIAIFRQYKKLADGAMRQVSDEQLQIALDADGNSIAIIVKHLVGNMRSRWTDFLTTDGEKPNRNRDTEFENPTLTRSELLTEWEAGWDCLLNALDGLSDADLTHTVMIRGEAHSVMQAINRQVAHYSSHVGQIILLSKHFAGAKWRTLSVARGASGQFNHDVVAGKKSQR
jgi:hypothetical protein